MIAILSDIHGNLEAFTAVLADIRRRGVETIYHLGNTFGYGPNPLECLELAMALPLVLKGNFDRAVETSPDGFCVGAEQSILWGQKQLSAISDPTDRERKRSYLAGLSSRHDTGNVLYVHASPRNPLNDHILPENVYHTLKMGRIWSAFDQLCFGGHTHHPGIFIEERPGQWGHVYAEECERGYPVEDHKLICKVGSVGQPRDEDERACYALFDGKRIWFRRVEYDIETTVRKIYAVPELLNFFGDRLREGR